MHKIWFFWRCCPFQKLGFFSLCFSLLTGCHIASPEFVVQGVNLKSAIHSLSEIQKKGEKNKLGHYVAHLRSNHAPGFAWDQYWKEVKNKNLYQNLTDSELSMLFSLNDVSCQSENMDSWADLLLEIAQSDSQKIQIIHPELKRIRKACSKAISDPAFKSIVWFFALERAKLENPQIQQAIKKAQSDSPAVAKNTTPTNASPSTTKKPSFNNSPTSKASPKATFLVQFPYTEELQNILLEEWTMEPKNRAWNDILSAVDRGFWSDIRWINWQQNNTPYLKNTLQMEWHFYQSINHIEQDLMWLFKNKNKMDDLLALFDYEKYLTSFGTINWPSFVQNLSVQFPKHPQNGNTQALISLFSKSCQARDFPPFSQLLGQWGISKLPNPIFCLNKEGGGGTQVNATPTIPATKELVNQTLLQLSPLDSVMYLLSLYEEEKHTRPLSDWKIFLESFSEENWLKAMHLLRKNKDRQNITLVLDIHARVYQNHIPFLSKDIVAVMQSEKESIYDMLENGYNLSYMNHPDTLKTFWQQISQTPKKVVDKVQLKTNSQTVPQNNPHFCSYSYVQNLYQFFAESDKTHLLLNQFRFDRCANFITDFRKKEWRKLTYQFKIQKEWDSSKEGLIPVMSDSQSKLVWWMARVLSLPHSLTLSTTNKAEEGDAWKAHVFNTPYTEWVETNKDFIQSAVLEMNTSEWTYFFQVMIADLKNPQFETNHHLFSYTSFLSHIHYPLAIEQAICRFFAEPNSHLVTQEYHPPFIWNLFLQVAGSKTNPTEEVCSNLVSPEKINTLLFVLSRGIFANLSATNTSTQIYIEQVKKQADHLVSLFKYVRGFDDSQLTHQDYLNSPLSSLRSFYTNKPLINLRSLYTGDDYDFGKGYLSNQAFIFYFSGLILEKLKAGAKNSQELKNRMAIYRATGMAPENPFDFAHREHLQDFLAYKD